MSVFRVAFCLLMYITLDFANPLLPGAVRFEAGSVDAVKADRGRPLSPTKPVALIPTSEPVVPRPANMPAVDRTRSLAGPHRSAATRLPRAPYASADPAVPAEDH